jgi:hypothetical protein
MRKPAVVATPAPDISLRSSSTARSARARLGVGPKNKL